MCNIFQTKECDPFSDDLKPLISIDNLSNCTQATHAVVGIDFGGNAVLSLKYSKENSDDIDIILKESLVSFY